MKANGENYNLSIWILGLEMALIYSTVFFMLGYQTLTQCLIRYSDTDM